MKKIESLKAEFGETEFEQKQEYGIEAVKTLLRIFQDRASEEEGRKIIDSVSSRIKSAESAAKKLERKGQEISFHNAVTKLNDIAGVRVVCAFLDDLYDIVAYLTSRDELTVIKCKDYIKKPKASGYQSVHLIIEMDYPLGLSSEKIRVEIQVRTVAMNYWAKLDHQLCYKKENSQVEDIRKELHKYALEISQIDKNMLKLRKRIETI